MALPQFARLAPAVVVCALVALLIAPSAGATSGTLVITANTTLAADHQGSIMIDADNVTLNCAGHTVSGPGTAGVDWGVIVVGRTGVTIKNCHVIGFLHGIRLLGATNADVRGNVVAGQASNGVYSTEGLNNSFRSNAVTANGAHGIIVGSSTGGSVLGNVVSDNGRGGLTVLASSSGMTIASNQARENGWSGIVVIGSSGNELRDNKTDGNVQSGISLQGTVEGIDSNNNTLTGNSAAGNGWFGIDLAYFSAVVSGDPSSAAFSNILKGNVASANTMSGIGVFGDSSLNVIHDNRARNNADYDGLDASTGSNTWTNNTFGTTSGI